MKMRPIVAGQDFPQVSDLVMGPPGFSYDFTTYRNGTECQVYCSVAGDEVHEWEKVGLICIQTFEYSGQEGVYDSLKSWIKDPAVCSLLAEHIIKNHPFPDELEA
jgi:hypothetical protein